ncbi:MAG: hypothetical protein HY535_00805 [Chloroflexi bacterium]|nr:hypothetical protein [Chloroflexota bacterium]
MKVASLGWWALGGAALLVLATAPGAVVHGQPAAQGAQPEVLGVVVMSLAVNPGEPVPVEVTVQNPLTREVEFGIALLVDEVPQEERRVRLPGQASRTLRFAVTRSQPGVHVVRLGPHAATFQVLSADVQVRELSVVPGVAAPGEVVALRATVENVGAAPGVYQVPLIVEGEVREVRSGLLGVGEKVTAAFELRARGPGSYSVLVGAVHAAYTVVGPLFDVALPSQLPLSVVTTSARGAGGEPLAITREVVSLGSGSEGVIMLPVALPPGAKLASFSDEVSGVAYDGETLKLPLRDAEYREVVRLEVQPAAVTGEGSRARVAVGSLRLVILETTLPLADSPPAPGPVTFGGDFPLSRLDPGMVTRLTPGRRPPAEALARLEVVARDQGYTVEAVALATLEMSLPEAGAQAGRVTFGIPSSSVGAVEELAVAHLSAEGNARFYPVSNATQREGRTLVDAAVDRAGGTFLLVRRFRAPRVTVERIILSPSVGPVGVPIEVRAVAAASGDVRENTHALLRVDGRPLALEPWRLGADGVRSATFVLTLESPGVFTVDVEGRTASLTVALPDVTGQVQVVTLSITPTETRPRQPIEVLATAANVGPRPAVAEVVLLVNDFPIVSRSVVIGSGELLGLRFRWVPERPGLYTIGLLNARGTVRVVVPPVPAAFEVTELRVEPETIPPGASATATFLLRNVGEESGVYRGRVFLNQQLVWEGELTVEGLTTLPVSVPVQPGGRGLFTVSVAGRQRELVVVSAEERSPLVLETVTVWPPTVPGGEPVTVAVMLRNRSSTPAKGVVTVLVNGEREGEREVEVGGEQSTQEVFSVARQEPGLYQVDVRQGVIAQVVTSARQGQFLVTRQRTPPSLEVSRVEVLPQPAAPFQSGDVNVLLANLGEQDGVFTLSVSVSGQVEEQREVALAGQTSRVLTLTLAGRAAGTYDVEVQGVKVQWTVRAPAPGVPTVAPPQAAGPAPSRVRLELLGAGAVAAALALGTLALMWKRRRVRSS